MKIHITGVNGFIGSWYKRSTAHNIVEVSRNTLFSNHRASTERGVNDDVLVNFAFDPRYQDNFKIIESCFNYAVANGISKLVFLGSIVEYDRVNNKTVNEETAPSPSRDIYTQEKLAVSHLIETLASKHPRIDVAIIQPTVVLGGGSWGQFLQRCLAHSKVMLPAENRTCNYVHISYLCEALDKLLQCKSFGSQQVNRFIVTQAPEKTWEQVLSDYGAKYEHNDDCPNRYHRSGKINFIFKAWNETPFGSIFNKLVKVLFSIRKGGGGGSGGEPSPSSDPMYVNGSARAEMMLDSRVETSKLSTLVSGVDMPEPQACEKQSKPTVIVIGSGIAGNVLANNLVETHRVIMLDKGPRSGFAYDHQREESLSSVPTYCYGKGGTSHLWHNGLIAFERSNISDPVMLKLLARTEPYLEKAARALGYDESHDLHSAKQRVLSSSELPDLDAIYYPNHRRVIKLDSRVEFYGLVRNLESILSNNGSVERIKFDSEGTTFDLETDRVVIAAGGLGTNGVIDSLKLPLQTSTNFIDHPMGFIGKIKVKPEYREAFARLCTAPLKQGYFKSGFTTKVGEHNAIFYIGSAFSMKNDLSLYRYKSKLGASSGLNRIKQMFSLKMFDPDVVAVILNHLFGWQLSKSTYTLMAVFEQRYSTNVINESQVFLNVSDDEIEIYNGHIKNLIAKLKPYIESVNVENNLTSSWLWSAAHFSGSLREVLPSLGDDLSLQDTKNVYLCSPSIFTEHSYTNTGVEIAALAFYLSKQLQ